MAAAQAGKRAVRLPELHRLQSGKAGRQSGQQPGLGR